MGAHEPWGPWTRVGHRAHIVELRGGTIPAESPGRGLGATFTATLPLRDAKDVPLDGTGERSAAENAGHSAADGQGLAAVESWLSTMTSFENRRRLTHPRGR